MKRQHTQKEIKDIEKEATLLEERLNEIKDLKRKIQLLKLEKGETSEDVKDWGKGVDDRMNAFEDIKDELEATLDKLEVAQAHQTKLMEDERERYQMERRLAEKLKIEETKLRMRSEFEKKDVEKKAKREKDTIPNPNCQSWKLLNSKEHT